MAPTRERKLDCVSICLIDERTVVEHGAFRPGERRDTRRPRRPARRTDKGDNQALSASQVLGREPGISDAIGRDRNVIFKIGIGEIPWLHQVTFSIWPDRDSMIAFAKREGPHAGAVRAVREGNWFKEELYARFRVIGSQGSWGVDDPLKTSERQVA
jgi:spheroidene monooxygenase